MGTVDGGAGGGGGRRLHASVYLPCHSSGSFFMSETFSLCRGFKGSLDGGEDPWHVGAINCQNVVDGLEPWAFLGISNQRGKGKASTLGSMGTTCQKSDFPASPARQGP